MRRLLPALAVLVATLVSRPAGADPRGDDADDVGRHPGRVTVVHDGRGRDDRDLDRRSRDVWYRHGYGRTWPARLPVPRTHYPRPGLCRVWYPNLAVSAQPGVLDCATAYRRAPAGSWIVHRPRNRSGLHVYVIDAWRPNTITRDLVYSLAGDLEAVLPYTGAYGYGYAAVNHGPIFPPSTILERPYRYDDELEDLDDVD